MRRADLWRVDARFLQQAQDDATVIAIRDQERAGLGVITDGEVRRESYSNRFATALEGVELAHPALLPTRNARLDHAPRVIGRIHRKHAVDKSAVEFLRANTDRTIRITVPGPFTMAQQAKDEFYGDEVAMTMDYAAAVNEELKDLVAAGADIVQLDEPYMQACSEKARNFGIRASNRALDGVTAKTAIHLCFGYAYAVKNKPNKYAFLTELENARVDQISIETAQPDLDLSILRHLRSKEIVLGVIDLSRTEIELPAVVADRIMQAVLHVDVERLVVAPDCGLKFLPRDIAFAKMRSMVQGAEIARRRVVG